MMSASKWRHLNGVEVSMKPIPLHQQNRPKYIALAAFLQHNPFEYIRHGTLSWFINFDVVTGEVIVPSWGPRRTEEDALA